MTGRASRRKGSAYERELCRDLARHGFTARRTPNSGGLSVKADITGAEGMPCVPGYSLEAKRHERLALPAWLLQAHAAAGVLTPALVFRRDARSLSDPLARSHVCVPWEEWLGEQAELRELRGKVAA